MTPTAQAEANAHAAPWLKAVRCHVSHLRYGSVQVTVQEGQVTQIEAVKKTRLLSGKSETGLAARLGSRTQA